jgi:RNA polymerase sigma-70 factor (ECF subfamily)
MNAAHVDQTNDLAAWVAAFCAGLSPAWAPHAERLTIHVEIAWRRARQAHPAIALTPEDFFAFVGERIRKAEPDPELALDRRNIEDLYLACGCTRGDPAALDTLERQTMPVVERGLAGLKMSADARREVVQALRERFLVASEGPPGIAAYDGRAPLAIWLRVCAARMGLRHLQRERRVAELDDDRLEELAPGVPNPELTYLRRLYGDKFKTAFREAVASLAPRERNLLRHSVIDELSIDQIAGIYHVHRATAARQVNQARAKLIEATRDRMRVTLRVTDAELQSILRMIVTMADVTLRQLLGKGPTAAEPDR